MSDFLVSCFSIGVGFITALAGFGLGVGVFIFMTSIVLFVWETHLERKTRQRRK